MRRRSARAPPPTRKIGGKMSAVKKSNDLLDANALEHLVGACERACASPSIRTPDGAASTSSSSFDERRQRQRERTKEFCSRLKPHVARITAKEVGLAAEEEEEEPKSFFTSLLKRVKKKYSRTFSSRSVYSQTVYGCENFQISTFIIPKGMEIPLHNHPAMTVFSKCPAAPRRCKRINGRMEITNTRERTNRERVS